MVTDRLPKKNFSQSKKLDWQGLVFYAKYIIRENSYFSELLPSRGCQKRQKPLKLLRFLYGGSSIHWPPKPTLSSSIFSHLFPSNFSFRHLPISFIFIYNFQIYFLLFVSTLYFKHSLSSPSLNNSEKNFFSLPAKIPRILYHPPSKKPLIFSLNKYTHFRIILEIPLQNGHQNYFPELLNPHLTI